MRIMNFGSYAAGLIFLVVALLARIGRAEGTAAPRQDRIPRWIFFTLNLLTLAFCFVAWWNARATFDIQSETFTYYDYSKSLPTTYDKELTLDMLLMLLACFSAFWSIRFWILRGWERTRNARGETAGLTAASNRRFTILLWVLSLNGMLLAIQGILQRLSGTPKLLWLRMSYWGDSVSNFGPFSYRGNAADYLNLLWPVALGFWWFLTRERRRNLGSTRLFTDGPELMLLPAVVIIATASFVTLSRGGVIVAAGLLLLILILFSAQKGVSKLMRFGVGALLLAVLAFVTFLGWGELIKRFREESMADLSGRTEIYQNSQKMAADFPIYGTGPGSFRSVYQLYRESATQLWHGFVHDDWLELRVTFGWVGFSLVLAQLLLLIVWVLCPGKPPAPAVFAACCGLALVGCLIHAKYDLPFQTYAIVYTFVVIAAVTTTITPVRK